MRQVLSRFHESLQPAVYRHPPLLIEYETGNVQQLKVKKGFPLMIHSNSEIEEREILLPPNSKLIC